jgi:hypothetical protein
VLREEKREIISMFGFEGMVKEIRYLKNPVSRVL